MHIPDGILPAPVCLAGYGATGFLTWYSLQQIQRRPNPSAELPKASLLSAAFFLTSSLSIPIPPASIHFLLNGLLGALLGDYAFLAILVGLLFQALAFGHGGFSTLGINALIMGVPALMAHALFQCRDRVRFRNQRWVLGTFGFLAGAVGVGGAIALFFGIVMSTISSDLDAATERAATLGLFVAHLPLVVLEGVLTAMLVLFLARVKPEIFKK